jgi:ABC-type dipeptide/oligopeptide/nickel transport system permease component
VVVYALRRLVGAVPVLLAVALLVFHMLHLVPGDPARVVGGMDATDEQVREIRRELRLDEPLPVQFARFLASAVTGDLGRSYVTGEPVAVEVARRLGATIELAVASLLLTVALGMAIGIVSARRPGSVVDATGMAGALIAVSIPTFWLGLLLQIVFSLWLGWLPSAGRAGWASLVLPAVTLSAFSVAIVARMTRSSLLEVLGQDFVRTAEAKGLSPAVVLLRHALLNALVPIVTILGLRFGYLLGGAVVTETVFAWPGLGRFIVASIKARDFPSIQGGILVMAACFVLVNLVVDLLYGWLDPRMRRG